MTLPFGTRMLPCPMFRSRHVSLRPGFPSAFTPNTFFSDRHTRCMLGVGRDGTACTPLSPFPATLTSTLQLAENKTTLSPAFATPTDNVKHKSFACHSYKKQPGWGYTPFSSLHWPSPRLFPLFPQPANIQRTATPASPIGSWLYFTVLWIPGGIPSIHYSVVASHGSRAAVGTLSTYGPERKKMNP